MTVIDHPAISSRYFFPRPDAPREGDRWTVDGLACARRNQDRDAAMLHFHGNGEVVADWLGDFAGALDAGGVDAYFAEYRGYGGSTGSPSLSALLADALTVFDAMARPPERVVVYGRSIGSLAAAHVAALRPVGALVLESGICDLSERLLVRLTPDETVTMIAAPRSPTPARIQPTPGFMTAPSVTRVLSARPRFHLWSLPPRRTR